MNAQFWHTPPERRKKFRRRLFWVVAIYAVIGFLILPPIVRLVAVKQLSKQLGREVSIQKVRLNPFVLSATIRGLLIKDKDGEPFVSWDEVYVNFQLSSFFGKAWVLKEVSTTKPFIRVQVNKDYTLNCSDLITKAAETNAPATPGKPLVLRVGAIQIKGATASLTDLTPRTPFRRIVGPLDVTLTGFETSPDNRNPYSFTGTTDAGEEFAWSGHFFLDPLRSEGTFALRNVTLNRYAPLYEDLVRFLIRDGTMDVGATYHVELSATNRSASVTNASFALRSFKLAEPGSDENIVEVPDFAVDGASVDAIARRVEIKSITDIGGKFLLQRGTNAEIKVVELSKPGEGMTNAPGGILLLLQSVTNAVAMLLNSTNQWSGMLHELDIRDSAITLEDLANSRPARLELDRISVTARNISNQPGTPLTASLSLRWNTNGTIKVDTKASLNPLSAEVQLALDGLDLHPLDPYLESKVDVFILNSKLGLAGKVQLQAPNEGLPEVKFQGDAWLNDFATADAVLVEDLLKWSSVRVSGIEANLHPPAVSIKEITVNDLFARIVVETNKTVNLLAALHMMDTNAPAPVAAKPEKGKRAKKPAMVAQDDSPPATNAAGADVLPKISITSVVISNAEMRLTDRSLSPTVNMAIQQLGGTISGLSSEDLQHAKVDLHAKVDNVGPVAITGTINPLGKNLTTDLKITVTNVDLTPTSPYAGKFAGYRIAKGKLGVELVYKISDRKLAAKNVIVLDQFTFGERVESAEATKLPVKLGVAVLKDRNGRIELDVPVAGSLDDPEFRIGKVVGRAILNVITKVLTSPFSVLGSVFGGKGEELSYQEFAPGSAALPPAGKEKLDALVKAMHSRPALEVEIEGSIHPEADRAGLRRLRLAKEIRTKKWMTLRKADRSNTTPDQVVLTPDDYATWLRTLYNTALAKGEISLTQPVTNSDALATNLSPSAVVTPEPEKGAAALLSQSRSSAGVGTGPLVAGEARPRRANDANEMAQALMTVMVVGDNEFQDLATARAKVVRDYILQSGQVEAERVFLGKSQTPGVKTQGNRAYLQLK